jgi:hypothetical protein
MNSRFHLASKIVLFVTTRCGRQAGRSPFPSTALCPALVERLATTPVRNKAEAPSMNERKTMTLNLTEREMQILEELSRKKELSKTAVVRQALRLYQVIDARLTDGEKLFFEDEKAQRRSEVMVL